MLFAPGGKNIVKILAEGILHTYKEAQKKFFQVIFSAVTGSDHQISRPSPALAVVNKNFVLKEMGFRKVIFSNLVVACPTLAHMCT